MSSSTDVDRIRPRTRVASGVKHSVAGPLEIVLGTVGGTAGVLRTLVLWIGRRIRGAGAAAAELSSDLSAELGDLARDLPAVTETLAASRGSRRGRRPLAVVAVLGLLAAGAAAFAVVRRSMQPEPSALAPSVEITPRP